jgi:hypothetical protein
MIEIWWISDLTSLISHFFQSSILHNRKFFHEWSAEFRDSLEKLFESTKPGFICSQILAILSKFYLKFMNVFIILLDLV